MTELVSFEVLLSTVPTRRFWLLLIYKSGLRRRICGRSCQLRVVFLGLDLTVNWGLKIGASWTYRLPRYMKKWVIGLGPQV